MQEQSADQMTQVMAVIGSGKDDGRLLLVVEWPDGFSRVLDRDEAVILALTILKTASSLFSSKAELSSTIAEAQGKIEPLHPAGVQ